LISPRIGGDILVPYAIDLTLAVGQPVVEILLAFLGSPTAEPLFAITPRP
jgi:hypothetical protein